MTLPVASKSPFTILANIGRLTNLIEGRGVDLVHARSRAPAWSAFLAARRTGKPFVTTYHGAYGEVGPFKAAYNSVMAKGDRVIANSRYTASVIEARAPRVKDVSASSIAASTAAPSIPPPSGQRGRNS